MLEQIIIINGIALNEELTKFLIDHIYTVIDYQSALILSSTCKQFRSLFLTNKLVWSNITWYNFYFTNARNITEDNKHLSNQIRYLARKQVVSYLNLYNFVMYETYNNSIKYYIKSEIFEMISRNIQKIKAWFASVSTKFQYIVFVDQNELLIIINNKYYRCKLAYDHRKIMFYKYDNIIQDDIPYMVGNYLELSIDELTNNIYNLLCYISPV